MQPDIALLKPELLETPTPEFSVVMPCLNEIETLETCIRKAHGSFAELELDGEVIIADNGSTDGSIELAESLGARVVHVSEKGYGNALRGGIAAARGRYVIMGDSDDSYDFSELGDLVRELRRGRDLVMGNRFRGGIMPGAMPWKHRWIGNPVLTFIGRMFFHCPARDFHCGLRGFSTDAYQRMNLQTTGMEFASEMVIRATLFDMDIAEVPVVLHKDGRSRPPHLRSWRDGWRHLRFMLLFSPRWLFLIPGAVSLLIGLVGLITLAFGPARIGGVVFDVNSMLVAGMAVLLGAQFLTFAVFTKMFAIAEGLHPPRSHLFKRPIRFLLKLETGVTIGVVLALIGLILLATATWQWGRAGFGDLNPRETLRQIIPACVMIMLGVQGVFASFFLSILNLQRRQ